MKTLKIFLAVLLFTTISFAQDNYTSSYIGEQIDNGVRPYKVYTALLTQTGENAPVATVLENTLGGTIVWTYEGVGYYLGTLANAFTINKTFFIPSGAIFWDTELPRYAEIMHESASVISIQNTQIDEGDNGFSNLYLEIRVYP